MAFTSLEKQAWRILLKARRELPRLLPRRLGPRIVVGGSRKTNQTAGSEQRVFTGGSISLATERLVSGGWSVTDARETLHRVVLGRFRKYAGQWNQYCSSDGWLRDLLQVEDEVCQKIVKRYKIATLVETARELQARGGDGLPEFSRLIELSQIQAELQKNLRKTGDHPAVALLSEVHGLHPELAKAVVLYGEVVPWWAWLAINAFIIIAGWLFWLAIVDPQNPAFVNESVGGVSWVHYTILPLFAVGMLGAEIWLVIDSPRREMVWREQLAKYERSVNPG